MLSRFSVVVLLAVCLWGCGKADKGTQSGNVSLSLPTVVAVSETLPTFYSVPGSVVSDDRVDLASRVVGFIQRLDVREGHKVARGDLLVQIDPSDINEAIRQGQSGVVAARNDLEDAQRDVEKYEKLAAAGWAPTETLRKAKVRRDIAQTTLTKAEAALASANAQKTYASIVSPVDGVVVGRYRNPGEMAIAGQPILTLESRQNLVLRVFVPEAQLARISQGMAATAHVDAFSQPLSGRVGRVVPSGDPTTRRYQVDVILPADVPVLPGMFGRVEFPLGEASALVVPKAALAHKGGLDGVYVADQSGDVRFRWLRLGREWQDQVEVVDGLSSGEKVVAQSDERLRDGVTITGAVHD